MAKRREFTRNQREEIVERSKRGGKDIRCEGCGQVLGAKPYEIDHIIAEALRPEADKQKRLTIAEGQLLGKCCHRGADGKTNKDVNAIAEAKRRYDRANGLKRPKQKIPSNNSLRTRPERDPNKGLPPLPRRKLYEERP